MKGNAQGIDCIELNAWKAESISECRDNACETYDECTMRPVFYEFEQLLSLSQLY